MKKTGATIKGLAVICGVYSVITIALVAAASHPAFFTF